MSILYTVRSKFTDPAQEDAWNEWYAGHLQVLLSVPGFLAAQRFHSSATVDDRPYLAMYEVAGTEVFASAPYRAIWGFDTWRPLIDNWTRDVSDPDEASDLMFATPLEARLWAGFASGPDHAVAEAVARARESWGGIASATVSGLDRSCTAIAWAVVDGEREAPPDVAVDSGIEIAQALYTPITACLGPADANAGTAR